jgi:hypothetical protein
LTLALQWGFYDSPNNPPTTQGFIYFDAVTSFSRSYTGSVSKHPIDGGGLITDHFTRENPILQISAVISAVDISARQIQIVDYDGNTPTNSRTVKEAVKISGSDNKFYKLLPSSAGQFFKPKNPDIILASQNVDTIDQIKDLLISLFTDRVELIKLFEYDNGNLRKRPIENLVMTSFVIKEDSDTGECLECDITLEQVSFAISKKTQVPQSVSSALVAENLNNKASNEDPKGKVDSTPSEPPPPRVTDFYTLMTGKTE